MEVVNESRVPIASLSTHSVRTPWWPVALSEQVGGKTPLGVVCNGECAVLYRDAAGQVRALEDRCRHRRAPLSLGRITANGELQCGYHGWTYDGASGMCTAIPNLSADERVPAHYAVQPYRVVERGGFVFIRKAGADEHAPLDVSQPGLDVGRRFQGSVTIGMAYDDYLAALADGPHLLMRIALVRITNYVCADPAAREGRVTMERGVVWAARRRNHRFVTDYPWTLRLACEGNGTTVSVELLTRDEAPALVATVGIAPAARGATAVHWRGVVPASARGAGAALLRAWAGARRSPFRMLSYVDGHALARLERLYSDQWLRHWQSVTSVAAAEPAYALRKGTIDGEYSV